MFPFSTRIDSLKTLFICICSQNSIELLWDMHLPYYYFGFGNMFIFPAGCATLTNLSFLRPLVKNSLQVCYTFNAYCMVYYSQDSKVRVINFECYIFSKMLSCPLKGTP